MRRLFALALVSVLVGFAAPSVAVNDRGLTASFESPAQLQGEIAITSQWAILEFKNSDQLSRLQAFVHAVAEFEYSNSTWISNDNRYGYLEVPVPIDDSGRRTGFLSGFQADWRTGGFLGIRADSIELIVSGTSSNLLALPANDGTTLATPPRGGNDDTVSPWVGISDTDQVFGEIVNPGPLHLVIVGLQAVELLGADVSCQADVCPTGGKTSRQDVQGVVIEQWSFERITQLSGTAQMTASPVRIRVGGPTLDIEADGFVRMPKAEVGGECDCVLEPDSTLTLAGQFTMAGLAPGPDGRMNTVLSGENVAAFNDETPILIGGFAKNAAATAVGVTVLFVAVKIALGLFTRLSKQEALEHPKRQKIFEYIQQHPGANFREVARNTTIAAGTVRHHLTVLERAGHVVEHAHHGTVRLFENHGKFDHNWSDLVLLREPPLAKLHDWLKQHPGSPQKAALEAMEKEGWSRSTTQHRLSRLVEGGVATIRLQGRLKIYTVVERQAPKPPMAQLIGFKPAFAS